MENRALREWAVAVEALETGRQIIVLRKGGIAEETKEFRLESPAFYLFPSYEHQRAELVKPEARGTVEATRDAFLANPNSVSIASYAEVTADLELTDGETLARLNDLHVWTGDYAEERLKWKRTKPLHVLVLRVYKLDTPIELPMQEAFGGCKSWITLPNFAEAPKSPVLDDAAFAARVEEVNKRIRG